MDSKGFPLSISILQLRQPMWKQRYQSNHSSVSSLLIYSFLVNIGCLLVTSVTSPGESVLLSQVFLLIGFFLLFFFVSTLSSVQLISLQPLLQKSRWSRSHSHWQSCLWKEVLAGTGTSLIAQGPWILGSNTPNLPACIRIYEAESARYNSHATAIILQRHLVRLLILHQHHPSPRRIAPSLS